MVWLVFVVIGSRIVNVRELVERELAIERGLDARRNAPVVIFLELPHPRVAGCIPIAISQPAAACRHLKTRVNHAPQESVLEALMEIPYLPQFLLYPAFLDELLKALELIRGKVISL